MFILATYEQAFIAIVNFAQTDQQLFYLNVKKQLNKCNIKKV